MFFTPFEETDNFWEKLSKWLIALTEEEVFPLDNAFKHHDPDCDIVQSASVGMMLATTAQAFMFGKDRFSPRSPSGVAIGEGIKLMVAYANPVFVHQGKLRPVKIAYGRVMTVTELVRYIDNCGRPTGQHGFKTTCGLTLPIDWRFFPLHPIRA